MANQSFSASGLRAGRSKAFSSVPAGFGKCDDGVHMKKGNIFSEIPGSVPEELFETLLSTDQFKLERIISSGQQTPAGKWYDQTRDEWVILFKGSAGLLFEGEAETIILHPGDYIHIPAHRRHRVEWTSDKEATVWLALHF